MIEVRPDFLNLKLLFAREILDAISSAPHNLTDNFGNTVSSHRDESLPETTVEILLGTKIVAKLRAEDTSRELMRNMLQGALDLKFSAVNSQLELEKRDLVTRDLDWLLDLSEVEETSLEDLLRQLLRLLRSHLWVEQASIFGIYDGFTLEGLAGIGGADQQNWKINFSTVAGLVATSRRPYHSEDPKSDENFRAKAGSDAPQNLLCYPLLHGKTLVGVMNLSNRIGGTFSAADLKVVERFCGVTAHLLQKHYLKKRMESFEKTSDHLGKYLSSKVVKNVALKEQLQLGGAEKKVVCLFSDIRGYTTITEGISPATLVQLLNFHFERMHAIIEKYEGTLDKIVGDLIMAVWNIPNDQPEPELLAMRTAIEMQKEMIRVVAPEWEKYGLEKVGMGVGVNAGLALVGNLGSSRFMNYTVIGDAVNTAQRLEAKARSAEIWMAESLFPFVNGKLEKPVRKETNIGLKGKENSIDAYVYRPLNY
jgi:class 3 adenylate cyclase